ncbi:hypothetical protein ABE522_14365 [Stenotrophomonas pennii]|uniref:hypothetical protein n=1 Tax=Stenotrophomonas lacuserhaii TaxID=2760084 RepID=UPI00320AD0FF
MKRNRALQKKWKSARRSYARFFGTPAARRHLPSRSTVLIAGLLNPGQSVEIEVTAVRRNAARE